MDAGDVFLGRYHCLEPLGEGPLGVTFRARAYGIGGFEREFAVKRLHDRLANDAAFIARLVEAANRAAQLQADRVAKLHELDRDEAGRCFVVSDYVRGISVDALLARLRAGGRRIGRQAALALVLDVAEALVYAHGRTDLQAGGVAHLSLSPPTIVVDPSGEAHVLDTGLTVALVRPGWTQDPYVQPRLAFLAPEVVTGRRAGAGADVFSLGALLHELTGGAPDDPALKDVIAAALKADAALRTRRVGDIADALIARVIDRGAARAELAEVVRRFVPPEPVASELPPREDETPPTPPMPDRLEWDTAEHPELPPEDAVTNEVRLPHLRPEARSVSPDEPGAPLVARELEPPAPSARPLPSPPTLPLSALREPPRRLFRLAAASVGVVAAGLAVGIGLAMSRNPPAPRAASQPAGRPAPDHTMRRMVMSRVARMLGPVEVVTSPVGARLWVDGIARGESPVTILRDGAPHTVVAVAEGYAVARRTVAPEDHGRLDIALEPAALPPSVAGPAGLKVRCQTRGRYRIVVDGADSGASCPNEEKLMVHAGRVQLGLYAPDADATVTVKKPVVLRAGGRTTRVYLKY